MSSNTIGLSEGILALSVTDAGHLRVLVNWGQGRECAAQYLTLYAGRASAATLEAAGEYA